jgi:uncharacterized phiE125 gp8 family phage protein
MLRSRTEPLRLDVTVDADGIPLELAELKDSLRVASSYTTDDALIWRLARVAFEACERYTRRSLVERTYTLWLDRWPKAYRATPWWDGVRDGHIGRFQPAARELHLPRPPLQSVSYVTVYDDSDNGTTFSSSKYYVDASGDLGRIVLRNTAEVPSPDRVANGIEIRFVAGYQAGAGSPTDYGANVPEPLQEGMRALVAFLYENRGDCPIESAIDQSGARSLWAPWRIMRML